MSGVYIKVFLGIAKFCNKEANVSCKLSCYDFSYTPTNSVPDLEDFCSFFLHGGYLSLIACVLQVPIIGKQDNNPGQLHQTVSFGLPLNVCPAILLFG